MMMKVHIIFYIILDLNTLTDEQNLEMQKKFNEALKEELSKPEN